MQEGLVACPQGRQCCWLNVWAELLLLQVTADDLEGRRGLAQCEGMEALEEKGGWRR